MLKVDLHIHTPGDPVDTDLQYTTKELIDCAVKLKYDVLAITWHKGISDISPWKSYAKKKNILLLAGAELDIEKKHTLVYNITKEEALQTNTFDDLYKIKDHALIGAPHPFFLIPSCLGKSVIEHKELFSFIEYSHFYTKHFNLNAKAVRVADQLQKHIVANSDLHNLDWFGKDYTLLDTVPNQDAIVYILKKKAVGINKKKVQYVTHPYSLKEFVTHVTYFAPKGIYYFLTKH
ncbi:MAG: PHP-associated domain-containing protein [Candidatus Woesearchaeota archaeon]|jgi:predicted metal-dependent phosphoesterase TrpH